MRSEKCRNRTHALQKLSISPDHFADAGAGKGRMLDTFRPDCVLTKTWF
jgi:hypothetical protein